MCFYTNENYKKILIADKDIVCYKFVKIIEGMSPIKNRQEVSSSKILMRSKVRNFSYCLDRVYVQKFRKMKRPTEVEYGFHSYIKLARQMRWHTPKALSTLKSLKPLYVKCIIPEGTKYYYNPSKNQYVSEKIKIVKVIVKKDKKTGKLYY